MKRAEDNIEVECVTGYTPNFSNFSPTIYFFDIYVTGYTFLTSLNSTTLYKNHNKKR